MPSIQRSPTVYNLQHLREYKSCRVPGGPVEVREQAVENDGKLRQGERPSSDAGGDMPTNNIYRCRGTPTNKNCRRGDTPTNKICRGTPRATHEQDRITNEIVWFRSRFFVSCCCCCCHCCCTRSPTLYDVLLLLSKSDECVFHFSTFTPHFRRLGSWTAAILASFDFIVSYSSEVLNKHSRINKNNGLGAAGVRSNIINGLGAFGGVAILRCLLAWLLVPFPVLLTLLLSLCCQVAVTTCRRKVKHSIAAPLQVPRPVVPPLASMLTMRKPMNVRMSTLQTGMPMSL